MTIYDLKYYPCAVKLDEKCEKVKINEVASEIYVCYEYSDDEDIPFDENDVTWGLAFLKQGKNLIKILDDETA